VGTDRLAVPPAHMRMYMPMHMHMYIVYVCLCVSYHTISSRQPGGWTLPRRHHVSTMASVMAKWVEVAEMAAPMEAARSAGVGAPVRYYGRRTRWGRRATEGSSGRPLGTICRRRCTACRRHTGPGGNGTRGRAARLSAPRTGSSPPARLRRRRPRTPLCTRRLARRSRRLSPSPQRRR